MKSIGTPAVAASLWAAAPSCPAIDAFVTISHDLGPQPAVNPGERVTLEVWIAWTPGNQFAGLRGDTIATNDLGLIAGDISMIYLHPSHPSNYLYNRGSPRGGSVINSEIMIIPGFFTASPNPFSLLWHHMTFIRFDWTAPDVTTPTLINFDFVPGPFTSNARFYPSGLSPAWVEANTTFIGTSLTVLPAPATALIPLALATLAHHRRRRPARS